MENKALKKIIALILSVSLSFSLFFDAFAESKTYYEDFKPSNINFSQMKYEKYDDSTFNSNLETVKKLINETGKSEEMFSLLEECSNEFLNVQTMYALATINASKENTLQNNETVNESYSIYMNMLKNFNSVLMLVYESDYKEAFIYWFGEKETEDFIKNYPTDKFYELSNDEQQLINEYMNNQFGTRKIVDNGVEYSLNDILKMIEEYAPLFELSDIELAKKGYVRSEISKGVELYKKYLEENNAVLGEIYKKLVQVRSEIAGEFGYDNYADYAYNEIYERDYTTEDIKKFRESVIQYIVPLYNELYGNLKNMPYEKFECSENEIIDIVGQYIGNISPEMEDTFNYMLKYNLFDISASDTKESEGTAYTVSLPKYKSAYLFESPINDSVWQFTTTVHEFGHFNSIIHDPIYSGNVSETSSSQNLDIAEIQSQGLEVLFMKYYGSIFEEYSAYEKIARICDMLSSIIEGCCYDEWQTEVYKHPDMSLEDINRLFGEISTKYGYKYYADNSRSGSWVIVNHNFVQPMYYISYAVSAISALEIWEQSLYNYDAALDKYMKMSAKGSFVPFMKTLNECGFRNVFDEESIKEIVTSVKDAFCLDLDNVKSDEWYYAALTNTIQYFSPQDNEFDPYDNASRGVTAEVLGRLYDEEKGITGEYKQTFSDTSSKYISWAASCGIVEGYDNDYFGAYDALTREQAATIVYHFAKYYGAEMSQRTSLENFQDADEVSEWSVDAFSWSVANGIINGRDNGLLSPKDNVSYAELAQMVANLISNVLTG